MFFRLLDHLDPMTDHEHVVARPGSLVDGVAETDLIEDGPHVQIVGHDQAAEIELTAQHAGDDVVRQGCGPARSVGIPCGVVGVACHYAVQHGSEGAEGREFARLHFFDGQSDLRQLMMGIDIGARVTGEMFATGQDAVFPQGVIEKPGVFDDLVGSGSVAPALEGVVGFFVITNIEDGAEIEVEPEEPQDPAREFAVAGDEFLVAFFPEILGVGRFVADQAQTRNAAAFLVDGDDGLDPAEVAKVVDESAELFRVLDVPPENDKTAWLEAAETFGGIGIKFAAGNPGEEELTEEMFFHSMQPVLSRMTAKLKSFFLVTFLSLMWGGCVSTQRDSLSGGRLPNILPVPSGGGSGVRLGIDVLEARRFNILRGKRVGLITNHTSYNRRGIRTRTVLKDAPTVNLVALYGPEHGINGTAKAGDHIRTRRDAVTGLIAHSLYGPTRKPSSAQLAGIDVMLFDVQDIGVRSYTYISTMILSMEACAENGIPFVVLDRPNPLGGHGVFGPPLESRWKSFVGRIPVPYVHGMTCGEIARMANARGWVSSAPQLTVVPMQGWRRSMIWEDTGLVWHQTSPNIPKARSPFYYAATGILGGLTGADIGIGTGNPFEYAGGKGVDPHEFTRVMQGYGFRGVRFLPYSSTWKPGHAGCRLIIDPRSGLDPVAVDVAATIELHRRVPGGLLRPTSTSALNLFNKVYGSEDLVRALQNGGNPQTLVAAWRASNQRFRAARSPFLLYH